MKNSLKKTGLSLSQAQSISNMCHQRGLEISNKLNGINNASKIITLNGKEYTQTIGKSIPGDIIDLLLEKSQLHATQAFLMENIKAKDQLLNDLKNQKHISDLPYPKEPEYLVHINLKSVDENWGMDQLTLSEQNEFLEATAYAAHIGQFIHKDGQLDVLRKQLPNITSLEWMEVEAGKKTPIDVKVHHTSEELLNYHEKLATLHRKYEMRVNYFKAKIKNLTTEENARISKENEIALSKVNTENAKLRNAYSLLENKWSDEIKLLEEEFETKRFNDIKETAQLKIDVDGRFQKIVALFLIDLKED